MLTKTKCASLHGSDTLSMPLLGSIEYPDQGNFRAEPHNAMRIKDLASWLSTPPPPIVTGGKHIVGP